MSITKIDFNEIRSSLSLLYKASSQIGNAKHTVQSVQWQIDSKIASRANIGNRFNNIVGNLSDIDSRILSIQKVCSDGITNYGNTDSFVAGQAARYSFSGDLTTGAVSMFLNETDAKEKKKNRSDFSGTDLSDLNRFINKDSSVAYDKMKEYLKSKNLNPLQVISKMNEWYNKTLTDEAKKISKAGLSLIFGSKVAKALDLINKATTGNFKPKNYVDIASLAVESSIEADVVVETFKAAFTYVPKTAKMDSMVENYVWNGEYGKAAETAVYGFNKLIVGGVVDVGAKVLDHQLKISETFAALEIVTGVDYDGMFNRFTSSINKTLEKSYGF